MMMMEFDEDLYFLRMKCQNIITAEFSDESMYTIFCQINSFRYWVNKFPVEFDQIDLDVFVRFLLIARTQILRFDNIYNSSFSDNTKFVMAHNLMDSVRVNCYKIVECINDILGDIHVPKTLEEEYYSRVRA